MPEEEKTPPKKETEEPLPGPDTEQPTGEITDESQKEGQKEPESDQEPVKKPTKIDKQTPDEKSLQEQPKKEPKSDEKQKTTEKTPPAKPEKKSTEPKKQPKKKDQPKDDIPDDFSYIVRIANTDINGDYKAVLGVAQIKGIGRRLASLIVDTAKIPRDKKMGVLTDNEVERIREALTRVEEIAPTWMLNHQKEYDTGENIHLISAQVELRLRDDINLLKMIRSYRGIRHELNLPARGQRTRANNRTGLTLGVSKKKN